MKTGYDGTNHPRYMDAAAKEFIDNMSDYDLMIDYEIKDSLFYCTNRTLASVGKNLFVNYSYL